jgi:PAS domain-containing protein
MEEDTRIPYTENFELGKVYREFEYAPDRTTLLQGAWNRFELETYGLLWNMAARISTHALWADFISINRQEILGPYSDDDKAALQHLLPHMSRGAELHRLVTRLEQLYGAVLAVLDKLLVGLVVLDTRGRVVLANTVARRTVEESGALRITSAGRSNTERERQVTGPPCGLNTAQVIVCLVDRRYPVSCQRRRAMAGFLPPLRPCLRVLFRHPLPAPVSASRRYR